MAVYKNWIAGEWIAGSDASSNVNPSDLDDTIGEYARADRHQVDVAIRAAAQALRSWRDAGILLRSEILDRAGGELLAQERTGRTAFARGRQNARRRRGEVARAGNFFKWFAGEAPRSGGEMLESVRPGLSVEIMGEPVGVMGLITPWNFHGTRSWRRPSGVRHQRPFHATGTVREGE